jgi:hypothetical protein
VNIYPSVLQGVWTTTRNILRHAPIRPDSVYLCGRMNTGYREFLLSEAHFPGMSLLGNPVNKGNESFYVERKFSS